MELGFTHEIKGTSRNGAAYEALINAPNEWRASRMYCKWPGTELRQVAHKAPGVNPEGWEFKGFGFFNDEAHFLHLLAMPPIVRVDALGDSLNNT